MLESRGISLDLNLTTASHRGYHDSRESTSTMQFQTIFFVEGTLRPTDDRACSLSGGQDSHNRRNIPSYLGARAISLNDHFFSEGDLIFEQPQ